MHFISYVSIHLQCCQAFATTAASFLTASFSAIMDKLFKIAQPFISLPLKAEN